MAVAVLLSGKGEFHKMSLKFFEGTKEVVIKCFEAFSSGADEYQRMTQNSRSFGKIRESPTMVFS